MHACDAADVYRTEASLSHELVRLLACKRTLLVLDDVRDARAVRACNPLGPHLLCTTFEGSIAKRLQTAVSSVGVRAYEMRVLSLPNMHTLLNAHFSFQVRPPFGPASAPRAGPPSEFLAAALSAPGCTIGGEGA